MVKPLKFYRAVWKSTIQRRYLVEVGGIASFFTRSVFFGGVSKYTVYTVIITVYRSYNNCDNFYIFSHVN